MENRISGNTLETTQTVVYSVTPRYIIHIAIYPPINSVTPQYIVHIAIYPPITLASRYISADHANSDFSSRVRSGRSPEDQVVVTIVTNSSSRSRIVEDLARELQIITRELGCQFTSVVRFGEHMWVAQEHVLQGRQWYTYNEHNSPSTTCSPPTSTFSSLSSSSSSSSSSYTQTGVRLRLGTSAWSTTYKWHGGKQR